MISTTTFILIVILINAAITSVLYTKMMDLMKTVKELTGRVGDLEEKTKNILLED